jgi:type VI secretion system secreted protein VgrG
MQDAHLIAVLTSPALSGEVLPEEVQGREAISRFFEYELRFHHTEELDADAVLGAPMTLAFTSGDLIEKKLHGVFSSFSVVVDPGSTAHAYTALFVPTAWDMTLHERTDVYLEQSIPDIVKKVLERSGVDPVEFRLRGDYPVLELVIQYRESDYALVRRLTQRAGIFFFFEHRDDATLLVFTDHNDGMRDVRAGAERSRIPLVSFLGQGADVPDAVSELTRSTRTLPKTYRLQEYNYRIPQLDLSVEREVWPQGRGLVAEHGAHYKLVAEGRAALDVRVERLVSERQVYEAKSNAAALRAGCSFELESAGAAIGLIVAELDLTFIRKSGLSSSFVARDLDVAYRSPCDAPVPRISGFVTGIIEGRLGSAEPYIDEEGRYRVRFLFDATSKDEAQASRPVRMMQPHAGAGYGMHFPLKPGAEVLIAFVNGDPDRPVIAGALPNPSQPSPVASTNHTKNVIRTVSGVTIEIDDQA